MLIQRHPANPVLTADQVPYDSTLVFNAGVAKVDGRYAMVFRNDYGDFKNKGGAHGTNNGLAWSDDGIEWEVEPEPCFAWQNDEIRRAYDPRLTVIEGRNYLCFAVDTAHGIRGGIAVTDDFKDFEILSLSAPDNRNMVLFPEKVGGKFARLERPFPMYMRPGEKFDIWFADSPDMEYWGNNQLVLGTEQVSWANAKLGPAAPPIKTERGWLCTFHGVIIDQERRLKGWEHYGWLKQYNAGLMLLDLDQPWKVIGMCREPLLVPQEPYDYELDGFRGSVIFPTGMILEDDGEVKIYYGAADTVIALATANVNDLLDACEPV